MLEKLIDQVEDVLNTRPETRNSDKLLTWTIWEKHYSIPVFIDKQRFMNLPSEDAVKRIRAKFQNDDWKYLPTNEDVAIQRRLNIDAWRKALGYNILKSDSEGDLFQ